MSEIDRAKVLLEGAAARISHSVPPDTDHFVAVAAGRRRARRARGTAIVLAVAAAVIFGSSVLFSSSPKQRQLSTAGSSTTVTTEGLGTAAALARMHWSNLPPAPIAARANAAIVWTGTEMFVWGGARAGAYPTDGALFDPVAQQWRALPSPGGLVGRERATALWTGREVLVIGDSTGVALSDPRATPNDGAYDPDTGRWRLLAARPAQARRVVAAVWTGHEVVALTAEGATAAYDPDMDRWRSLPPIPETSGVAANLVPVWAGDRVLVWVMWGAQTTTSAGSVSGQAGVDLFSLDIGTGTWTGPHAAGFNPGNVQAPVWTGRDVLLSAAYSFNGGGAGPVSLGVALRFDPATDHYTPISKGPADDGSPGAVWTGAAFVQVAHAPTIAPVPLPGDGPPNNPVEAPAAWDPTRDAWTVLDRLDPLTNDTRVFWTGQRLMAYGANGGAQLVP